jgi:hypothetical protein
MLGHRQVKLARIHNKEAAAHKLGKLGRNLPVPGGLRVQIEVAGCRRLAIVAAAVLTSGVEPCCTHGGNLDL